jgi:hypothetical protein
MNNSALIVGVYLLDKPSYICQIKSELSKSSQWEVEQRWVGLGTGAVPEEMADATLRKVIPPAMKFPLLNQLLAEAKLGDFEFVLVCDDDIVLPENFLDRYLDSVNRYGFALAQPARTHDSFGPHMIVDGFRGHPFVEQLDGLLARQTRFVEIGPIFSVHRSAFDLIFPFDNASPMGWGYDFVWPQIITNAGLKMGIIDAVPIAHSLRKSGLHYQLDKARGEMDAFLAHRPHVSPDEAFFIVESYAA